MKRIVMIAAVSAAICSPAFAGGSNNKNALNVGAVVSTGKGGLVGSLLGSNSGKGNTGVGAAVSLNTGKNGVLGLLLGSKDTGHGGNQGGGHGHY